MLPLTPTGSIHSFALLPGCLLTENLVELILRKDCQLLGTASPEARLFPRGISYQWLANMFSSHFSLGHPCKTIVASDSHVGMAEVSVETTSFLTTFFSNMPFLTPLPVWFPGRWLNKLHLQISASQSTSLVNSTYNTWSLPPFQSYLSLKKFPPSTYFLEFKHLKIILNICLSSV